MVWRELGRCWSLDTGKGESDLFFEEWRLEEANLFCNECVVKAECLDEAIWTNSAGTWAGTTLGKRRYMRENKHTHPDNPVLLQILQPR